MDSHISDANRDKLVQAWFDGSTGIVRAWKSRFHAEMTGETLSMGQLSMLFYLARNQPVSGKQIAADTHNSKSAVAQLLDGLDKAGLIMRQPDPSDRRVIYVSLTKAGADKVRSLEERRKAFFVEMSDELSDEEIAVMVEVQRKLICKLEKKQGKAVTNNENS